MEVWRGSPDCQSWQLLGVGRGRSEDVRGERGRGTRESQDGRRWRGREIPGGHLVPLLSGSLGQ